MVKSIVLHLVRHKNGPLQPICPVLGMLEDGSMMMVERAPGFRFEVRDEPLDEFVYDVTMESGETVRVTAVLDETIGRSDITVDHVVPGLALFYTMPDVYNCNLWYHVQEKEALRPAVEIDSDYSNEFPNYDIKVGLRALRYAPQVESVLREVDLSLSKFLGRHMACVVDGDHPHFSRKFYWLGKEYEVKAHLNRDNGEFAYNVYLDGVVQKHLIVAFEFIYHAQGGLQRTPAAESCAEKSKETLRVKMRTDKRAIYKKQ